MVDLGEHFSYNDDYSDISNVFEDLSRQLKIIHNNEMIVPYLNSKSISCDDGYKFVDISEPSNMEVDRRGNIRSLAKLMLGTYLSNGTGFKDFSLVADEWFTNNIGDILQTITADNFYGDYFEDLFVNGSCEYYSDFLDRKRQEAELNKSSNVNGFKKVLKTAASSLYEDEEEHEDHEEEFQKNASLRSIFYPVLIGSLLLVSLFISLFIKINH